MDYFHLNSWITGIVDVDVVPTSAEPQLSQCQPPLSPIHIPAKDIVPCTQPDVEAPVCDTTPINQTDVVDDDLLLSKDVVVEVKIAHPIVIEDDDVEALAQAPPHKVFLVPSIMHFYVPLLVLVLVYIDLFLFFISH